MIRATAALSLLLVLTAGGCAGARFDITADSARYPVSLSPAVRDGHGRLYEPTRLRKVGNLTAGRTAVGLVYSAVSLPSRYDISDEVNAQVPAVGGEAVVGLAVSLSTSCNSLNLFPLLNALPLWPGCSSISITGDIVRRLPVEVRAGEPQLQASAPAGASRTVVARSSPARPSMIPARTQR